MICRQCLVDKDEDLFAKNRRKCKQCISSNNTAWQKINVDKVKVTQMRFIKNNKDKIDEQNRIWYQANKIRLAEKFQNEKVKIYAQRTEARKDILVKLKISLRNRLYSALKNNSKRGSAVSALGCTIEELKKHLESKFYHNSETGEAMSWGNYGFYGWHIDHKIPLSFASSGEELLLLCHYSNLQPLWAVDNLKKGVHYDNQPY